MFKIDPFYLLNTRVVSELRRRDESWPTGYRAQHTTNAIVKT